MGNKLEAHAASMENMAKAMAVHRLWLLRAAQHGTSEAQALERLEAMYTAAREFVQTMRARKSLAREIAGRSDKADSPVGLSEGWACMGGTMTAVSDVLSTQDAQQASLQLWQDTLAKRRQVILDHTDASRMYQGYYHNMRKVVDQ